MTTPEQLLGKLLLAGAGIKRLSIYRGDQLIGEGQQSKTLGHVRVRWAGAGDVPGHLGTQSEYESLGAMMAVLGEGVKLVWHDRVRATTRPSE